MRVTLSLLFSHNDKIGSKLISWLCSHRDLIRTSARAPSHVAILVNDRWVFESTLEGGVHVSSIEKWSSINSITHTYKMGVIEYEKLADIIRSIKGKRYDYKGALFLGLSLLLNKFLGIPLPSKNYLEDHDRFFCTEVLEKLIGKDLSMRCPADILSLGQSFVKISEK